MRSIRVNNTVYSTSTLVNSGGQSIGVGTVCNKSLYGFQYVCTPWKLHGSGPKQGFRTAWLWGRVTSLLSWRRSWRTGLHTMTWRTHSKLPQKLQPCLASLHGLARVHIYSRFPLFPDEQSKPSPLSSPSGPLKRETTYLCHAQNVLKNLHSQLHSTTSTHPGWSLLVTWK